MIELAENWNYIDKIPKVQVLCTENFQHNAISMTLMAFVILFYKYARKESLVAC